MPTDLMRSERSGQGMGAVAGQLAALWRRQSRLARLGWVACLIAALVLGGWWNISRRPPEWVTLITTPYGADAAECVAALQAEGIAARAREHDVEVQPAAMERARQVLTAAGLPDLNLGMHLFDESSPMRSSLGEQVNLLRAQQDELARSLSAMEPIARARVHLAMGKPSIFRSQELAPSAAVALRLHKGATLSAAQVRGIRQLVAGSVTGMRATDVRVIDDKGAVLDDGERPVTDWQAHVERTTGDKVQSMLEQVVGVGNVVVVVSARLAPILAVDGAGGGMLGAGGPGGRGGPGDVSGDSDATSGSAASGETASGDASAVAGAQDAGGRSQDGGLAGPVSLAAPQQALGRSASPRGPAVAQLQVAVLIDSRLRGSSAPPPSEADLQGWRALARSAAGLDERRGDRLELRAMPFSVPTVTAMAATAATAATKAAPPSHPGGEVPLTVILAIAGSALLVTQLLALWMVRRARRRADHAEAQMAELGARVLAAEQKAAARDDDEARPTLEQAVEAARADPQRTAMVIAAWLRQDGRGSVDGASGGGA
jgi:flagellar M-ring protein FliF